MLILCRIQGSLEEVTAESAREVSEFIESVGLASSPFFPDLWNQDWAFCRSQTSILMPSKQVYLTGLRQWHRPPYIYIHVHVCVHVLLDVFICVLDLFGVFYMRFD